MRRHIAFSTSVALALASLIVTQGLSSASQVVWLGHEVTAPAADEQPKLLPPPVIKPAQDFNGRTDLPNAYEPGAIKLKMRVGLDVHALLARHGVTGGIRYLSPPPFSKWDLLVGFDREFRVQVPVESEKALVRALAKATAEFEWVEMVWLPNGRGALLAPNDPIYNTQPPQTPNQQYLSWINMERAWDRTVSSGTGPGSIAVAVLDSGLYAGHQDAGVWKQRDGWDYLISAAMPAGQATDTGCYLGHGTKVATMAAGDTNNGLGIAGTGFNSAIMPMKVLRADCSYGAMANGSITYDWPIRYATAQGALVINMSYDIGTYLPPEMLDALTAAYSAGVTPVAAAGNSATDHRVTNHYPCDASYVICVGGVQDSSGTKWSLSDFGTPYVNVMAPSVNIVGATSVGSNDYRADSGTSYASPLVAGVFALLRSLGYSPAQQWNAIASTAQYPAGDPSGNSQVGLINAGAALWH